MSIKRSVSAGVVDTGLASLATFVVGVQAVRTLEPAALGAYALVFATFSLLMEVSTRLVFQPAEIDAARRPKEQRLSMLSHSLPVAAPILFLAGILATAVVFFMPDEVPSGVAVGLIVTAVPCTMVSPLQDHIRNLCHVGGKSSVAAGISAIQLATVVMALVGLVVNDVAVAWHPFGALFAANALSAGVGVLAWRRVRQAPLADAPTFTAIFQRGRWHLLAAGAPKLGGFAAASLVAHLAGASALGFAEGARVLARPVSVLSQGLKNTLGPPLMRAVARHDRTRARRLSRSYALLVGLGGTVYLLGAGFGTPWNPLVRLMPSAFAVPWLVAATIAIVTIDRIVGAGAELQMFGAGRERRFAVVEMVSSVGHIAGGLTAGFTGAFAIVIGQAVTSAVRRPWLALELRDVYRRPGSAEPPTDRPRDRGGAPAVPVIRRDQGEADQGL